MRVAEVVLQDVGVVDAGIERDRAGHFHVSPRGDDDAVAATHIRLHDELRLADRAVIQERAHQPIHRVAAIVLGYRQNPATLRGRGDDAVAAAYGQRQRLLA